MGNSAYNKKNQPTLAIGKLSSKDVSQTKTTYEIL
jgi:hypothetical protein